MTYRTIEHQVAICHANLIDLQHYLQMIQPGEITPADWDGIRFMLTYLRKHLDKPIMLPRIDNHKPRS